MIMEQQLLSQQNLSVSEVLGTDIKRTLQVTDLAVTKRKYEQEVKNFREAEKNHLSRGVILVKEKFPKVILAFVAPMVKPIPIIFGVEIDFTNYDSEPPSVTFINPLTGEFITWDNLPLPTSVWFCRSQKKEEIRLPDGAIHFNITLTPSLLQRGANNLPFVCLPGIREYHQHPAHTGDSWMLHRKSGEGTLGFIIDQLHKYGIQPLGGYQVQAQVNSLSMSFDPQKISE